MTARQLFAEFLGTALLLCAIVGSGIMADRLSDGSVGLALFMHAASIGAILVALVLALGPISGAHFNPAVTVAFLVAGQTSVGQAIAYIAVQLAGAVLGVVAAHLSFDMAPVTMGVTERTGPGLWLGEAIATFTLVFIIFMVAARNAHHIAQAVGLTVMAAIIFTSSTCFANPAVTFARALTDTFTSIAPADTFAYVAAQLAAAVGAAVLAGWLLQTEAARRDASEIGDAPGGQHAERSSA